MYFETKLFTLHVGTLNMFQGHPKGILVGVKPTPFLGKCSTVEPAPKFRYKKEFRILFEESTPFLRIEQRGEGQKWR